METHEKGRGDRQDKQTLLLVLDEESLEGLVRRLGLALGDLDVAKTLLGVGRGVWVEAEEDLLVAERVLLLHVGALGDGSALGGAEDALDFAAVDELGDVGLSDRVGGEEEVLLEGGRLGGGAVDLVEGLESRRGPDDETAEVTAGGELEEVQAVDGGSLNTRDVAESADEILSILVGVVDDERTTTLLVATVPELTLTSTELAGRLDLLDIGTSTDGLEESKSGRGLGNGGVGEGGRGDNERNLGDGGDVVTTGKEKGSAGRSSDGGSSGETPVFNSCQYLVQAIGSAHVAAVLGDAHFWPRLIFWCHFLQTLVGANMRPERHMLPKAA